MNTVTSNPQFTALYSVIMFTKPSKPFLCRWNIVMWSILDQGVFKSQEITRPLCNSVLFAIKL